jgi:hypothetical protein
VRASFCVRHHQPGLPSLDRRPGCSPVGQSPGSPANAAARGPRAPIGAASVAGQPVDAASAPRERCWPQRSSSRKRDGLTPTSASERVAQRSSTFRHRWEPGARWRSRPGGPPAGRGTLPRRARRCSTRRPGGRKASMYEGVRALTAQEPVVGGAVRGAATQPRRCSLTRARPSPTPPQAGKQDPEQPPMASQLQPLAPNASVDALVVGCGPAGLYLAAQLAQRGLSVGLVGAAPLAAAAAMGTQRAPPRWGLGAGRELLRGLGGASGQRPPGPRRRRGSGCCPCSPAPPGQSRARRERPAPRLSRPTPTL